VPETETHHTSLPSQGLSRLRTIKRNDQPGTSPNALQLGRISSSHLYEFTASPFPSTLPFSSPLHHLLSPPFLLVLFHSFLCFLSPNFPSYPANRRPWQSRVSRMAVFLQGTVPYSNEEIVARILNKTLALPSNGELNPHRSKCLFPSLSWLSFGPIRQVPEAWWTSLARKAFPNLTLIKLVGEMNGRTDCPPGPIDNKEELFTERAILVLTSLLKRLRRVEVIDGWKNKFVFRNPQKPAPTYFAHKQEFLNTLKSRGVEMSHRIALWSTYRDGGGFGTASNDNDITLNA